MAIIETISTVDSGSSKRRSRHKDISNGEFNGIKALRLFSSGGHNEHAKWTCLCHCGKEFVARGNALRQGKVSSCGCLIPDIKSKNATTHGMTKTREYKSWGAMIARCYNPKNNRYYLYGARGVVVEKSWRKFENFFNDMGIRPTGKSLDRVDGNGDYCKSNCRWATPKEQANNRRNNKK